MCYILLYYYNIYNYLKQHSQRGKGALIGGQKTQLLWGGRQAHSDVASSHAPLHDAQLLVLKSEYVAQTTPQYFHLCVVILDQFTISFSLTHTTTHAWMGCGMYSCYWSWKDSIGGRIGWWRDGERPSTAGEQVNYDGHVIALIYIIMVCKGGRKRKKRTESREQRAERETNIT